MGRKEWEWRGKNCSEYITSWGQANSGDVGKEGMLWRRNHISWKEGCNEQKVNPFSSLTIIIIPFLYSVDSFIPERRRTPFCFHLIFVLYFITFILSFRNDPNWILYLHSLVRSSMWRESWDHEWRAEERWRVKKWWGKGYLHPRVKNILSRLSLCFQESHSSKNCKFFFPCPYLFFHFFCRPYHATIHQLNYRYDLSFLPSSSFFTLLGEKGFLHFLLFLSSPHLQSSHNFFVRNILFSRKGKESSLATTIFTLWVLYLTSCLTGFSIVE